VNLLTELLLYRIWGSHSCGYEYIWEYMEYNALSYVESQPAFRRNISPPSSGSNKPSKIPTWKPKRRFYFQRTARRYVPEDSTAQNGYCFTYIFLFSSPACKYPVTSKSSSLFYV
jgi:hypothetical protein